LGKRETSVVLSLAILYFDQTKAYSYEDLLEQTLFVKFNAKEQIEKYHRTFDKDTITWWKKKCEIVQAVSFIPSSKDMYAFDGINLIKDYIHKHTVGEEIVWTRGSLDQFATDGLCDSLEVPYLFKYGQYRDMRTAIDLLKETSTRGYCKIPNFDFNKVFKHDPVHDVALDVMMLLYGE
jgi:3' exoribonuclease, RNase T-like